MLRKWVALLLSSAAVLLLPGMVFADQPLKIYMKANPVVFDVGPVVENGTTLVPFRPMFEKLGLTVDWHAESKQVTGTRRGVRIELTVGSQTGYVNGEPKQLAVAPKMIRDSLFVPLRFVGEASDYRVAWEPGTRSVDIQPTNASLVLDAVNDAKLVFTDREGRRTSPWNGAGTLTNSAGTVLYDGETVDGKLEGQGVFTSPGILKYEGSWKNSRFEGQGKLYADGSRLEYEGGFKQGLRDGKGKYYDASGRLFYEGDFVQDRLEGYGKFYSPEGAVSYEGHVADGKPEGSGTLFNEGGALYYQGDFKDGKCAETLSSNLAGRLGANRQWNSFETRHFHIYYEGSEETVRRAAAEFDTIYDLALSRDGQAPALEKGETRIPVYLLKEGDYQKELNAAYENIIGEWDDTRMYLNLKAVGASDSDMLNRVFRHEIIHAMTLTAAGPAGLPGWFTEGAAVYHDFDAPYDKMPNVREEAMRQAVREKNLLPWGSLAANPSDWGRDSVLAGYGQAWSIWQYLVQTYGEEKLLAIFGGQGEFGELLIQATGKTAEQLEADWKAYAVEKYSAGPQ